MVKSKNSKNKIIGNYQNLWKRGLVSTSLLFATINEPIEKSVFVVYNKEEGYADFVE